MQPYDEWTYLMIAYREFFTGLDRRRLNLRDEYNNNKQQS
jgi:hypothetical protein